MDIKSFDIIKLIIRIYSVLYKMNLKTALKVFLKPAETTRYIEFSYLLRFLTKSKINRKNKILDVSSPFVISYILSGKNEVLKTDINSEEKLNIRESKNLKFKIEDATKLTFKDNTFDLVYSISVIEHIYQNYLKAVQEMVRVSKQGGFVYLTFPVSNNYKEEWLEFDIYSHQYKNGRKTFFQYRFDKAKVEELLSNLTGVEVISKDIFWERKDGLYDKTINRLRKYHGTNLINYILNSLINLYAGFRLLERKSRDFSFAKSFGNISIILKKI